MAQSGVNLAVTEDGASYNKLRRPDDYLESLTAQPPPKSELPPAKRKFEAVTTDLGDEEEPHTKRSREEDTPRAAAPHGRRLARDAHRVERPVKENGMQTMFPGLDDDSASDADDTTRDALAYLRSVRSEASTIPTLLVAPSQAPKNGERDRSTYNDSAGDHRVRFHEGTWVAVDDDEDGGYYDDDEWAQYDDIDPQAAYYKSLLRRYNAHRNKLGDADPRELATLIKANPEKYANLRVPYSKGDWRYAFDNKYPTPALVAQLDDKGLYRALDYVSEVLIIGNTISKQKSCWIWTLLALAGDSGTLDYYKVGRIRELGHKAGQLSIRLRSGERRNAHRLEEGDDAEEWEAEGGDDGEGGDHGDMDVDQGDGAHETSFVLKEQRQDAEDDEVDEYEEDYEPPLNIGGQFDGTAEQQTQSHSAQPTAKAPQDDTPNSEDEGEIKDDNLEEEDTPASLEAARARLLAQLGDNLVSDSIPDRKVPAHQLRATQHDHNEPRKSGKHRHNGKRCNDPSCPMTKARQETHRRAALRGTQGVKAGGGTAALGKQAAKPAQTQQRKDEQHITQRKRTHEEALAEARRQAASMPEDTDPATFLASLEPELRRAVLKGQDEAVLAGLPPDIATEAESTARRPDEEGEREALDEEEEGETGEAGKVGTATEMERGVDVNTRVTIDMILTVVGECYGQRDLLGYREVW